MVSIYWFRFRKLFPEIFQEHSLIHNILGMNKMVINHLEKLFVTSDAHTIINESDINHPAARMIAQAAKMQQNECGDNTNLVLTLCGELMS
jgi:T-complex protein 1 subunit theta